jgi:hypothetical protein
MPIIDFGAMALRPVADSTGLTPYLESSLPSSSDGLANPNQQQQQPAPPSFTESFQDKPPAPALPQPPKVNFRVESESLYGKNAITNFLNKLRAYSDDNAAFQDLVNEYDQQSFDTPGGVNPRMKEYMNEFEGPILREARYLLQNPNDNQRHNGPNGFYGLLDRMAKTIRPTAAEPTPFLGPQPITIAPYPFGSEGVAPSGSEGVAPSKSKSWYEFWKGGRKTARNRSRNHSRSRSRSRSRSGKKTRARKLKQRSRKRAVRRR